MIKYLVFLTFVFLSICLSQNVTAQVVNKKNASEKVVRLFDRGMKYVFNGVDNKALDDFEKVIQLEPNFIEAYIQIAAIQYERKDYEQAEKKFEQALAISDTYEPKVLYTLALTELKLNKKKESVEHLEKFIEVDSKYDKLKTKASTLVETINFRSEALLNPVPFDPINLGAGINTTDLEYLPSLTADGQTMVYTRRILPPSGNVNRGNEDFYISHFKDGKWTEGRALETINRPETNEGAQSLSADGKLLVFTICDRRDSYGGCDLYYSQNKKGIWSAPKNLGNKVNSRAWETQPSIAANKKSIYFASKRDGSKGGSDIWVTHRESGGTFDTPINLGDQINTPGDEQSPFIHPDGETLYFMSNGHPGIGKTDLFYARLQEDGTWGRPTNLGYPINSEGHEGALVVSTDGKNAFFASDRFHDSRSKDGKIDIYSFELYPAARPNPVTYLKANVIDAITGEPLKATVELSTLIEKEQLHFANTDSEGNFLVCLPAGKRYALNVSKEGYLFHSENFALEKKENTDPYLMTIPLQPIVAQKEPTTSSPMVESVESKPIILRNVFFETASAALLPESTNELNKLIALLNSNPNLNIQISGHTDNVGSVQDNQRLSENRAKAVYQFLIDGKIDASRLKFKGYGESQPIDSNETDLGKKNNRRTEFIAI